MAIAFTPLLCKSSMYRRWSAEVPLGGILNSTSKSISLLAASVPFLAMVQNSCALLLIKATKGFFGPELHAGINATATAAVNGMRNRPSFSMVSDSRLGESYGAVAG